VLRSLDRADLLEDLIAAPAPNPFTIETSTRLTKPKNTRKNKHISNSMSFDSIVKAEPMPLAKKLTKKE
jgi:hypothetical protein